MNMAQSAGHMELLNTTYEQAEEYTRGLLNGKPVEGFVPTFKDHYLVGHTLANVGIKLRCQMPVLDEIDIDPFKDYLANIDHIKTEQKTVHAIRLLPFQRQIYFDKSIGPTVQYGVEGTTKFLKSAHLFITEYGDIIDGHHRWLSAVLIDPMMELPTFVVDADMREAYVDSLAYSDEKHHERNA